MAATQDELKKQVGFQAIDDYVESGMVVGLGTGSTAAFAVERLGEKLAAGALLFARPRAARAHSALTLSLSRARFLQAI